VKNGEAEAGHCHPDGWNCDIGCRHLLRHTEYDRSGRNFRLWSDVGASRAIAKLDHQGGWNGW